MRRSVRGEGASSATGASRAARSPNMFVSQHERLQLRRGSRQHLLGSREDGRVDGLEALEVRWQARGGVERRPDDSPSPNGGRVFEPNRRRRARHREREPTHAWMPRDQLVQRRQRAHAHRAAACPRLRGTGRLETSAHGRARRRAARASQAARPPRPSAPRRASAHRPSPPSCATTPSANGSRSPARRATSPVDSSAAALTGGPACARSAEGLASSCARTRARCYQRIALSPATRRPTRATARHRRSCGDRRLQRLHQPFAPSRCRAMTSRCTSLAPS